MSSTFCVVPESKFIECSSGRDRSLLHRCLNKSSNYTLDAEKGSTSREFSTMRYQEFIKSIPGDTHVFELFLGFDHVLDANRKIRGNRLMSSQRYRVHSEMEMILEIR